MELKRNPSIQGPRMKPRGPDLERYVLSGRLSEPHDLQRERIQVLLLFEGRIPSARTRGLW